MYGEVESRQPVVLQPPDTNSAWSGGDSSLVDFNIEGSNARSRFREFFRNFRLDNVFIYRDALIRNWNRRDYFVEVDLSHLNQFDEILFNNLQVLSNYVTR
jgi:DNA replication licensing factor MCM5